MLLSSIIENALLNLYVNVSAAKGFTPLEKRNHILSQYLKPKLKDPRYKSIKNELKQMLYISRTKRANLEKKLWELNAVSVGHRQKINDAAKLFDQLNFLHDEHGIDAKLSHEKSYDSPSDNTIYVSPEHIEHCFNQSGKQTSPLSLLIQGDKASGFAELINIRGLFRAERKEWNEKACQAHILLHPLTQS
ncbi:DUF2913 family protein [Enterovibrio norvegicus]|uniref:DUF2913 domain-containing protein n=1 Tax=Enterovibrio norvegicus TaxID=188144 RepID=A0A2N7L8P2_9GAMM|nr:DUF2913 family protein [Enterovibrio norvegicus]PMN90681.1 hypothetical protein BCT23_04130 [Enterovibrio norvegicus]